MKVKEILNLMNNPVLVRIGVTEDKVDYTMSKTVWGVGSVLDCPRDYYEWEIDFIFPTTRQNQDTHLYIHCKPPKDKEYIREYEYEEEKVNFTKFWEEYSQDMIEKGVKELI